MGRIRVEENSDITRPEREQTSYAGAPLRDSMENLLKEEKQMAAISVYIPMESDRQYDVMPTGITISCRPAI